MTFPILDIEKSSVEKYLSNMVQDSNHRFKSWEYCYTAFGNLDSVDYLSLHLAFYLASWGMYRGEFYQFNLSSCIRQQNSLTAQFVSFSLSNLANIFYPPQFLQ